MSAPLPGKYKVPLNISSWITFAIALTFYWITADPGVSYWDCPEYVTVASKMEIGHPPGNPVWMLAMRVATIPFAVQHHAYVINLCSGIFMSFAAFFLCRIIFVPVRLYFINPNLIHRISPCLSDYLAIFISIGASLCFAFCDSAWFSAVETEVYAMSTFIAALSLWIMTLWWWEKSTSKKYRLLILVAYLTGLSLGIHQLNLLLIPVFALIIFYKKRKNRVSPVRVLAIILLFCLLLAFILMAFIPGVLYGAQSFELFGVNVLGLPYDSGVLIFILLIFSLVIIGLILTHPPLYNPIKWVNIRYFNISLWMGAFLLLGFSSFGIIMIRAKAMPPMNEGSPDNIFSLASYIKRDQYPSSPLIYGETLFSHSLYEERFIDGKPNYSRYLLKKEKGIYQPFVKDAELHYRSGMLSHEDSLENRKVLNNNHGYILSDYKFSQVLTPELNMWLPRMTSGNPGYREAYEGWAGLTHENMVKVEISETIDSTGNYVPRLNSQGERNPSFSFRPSYYQNFRYFLAYQSYYMYFRYLLWNFVGKQNDFHSNGEVEHGNFVTGFSFIDDKMIGKSQYFPKEIWEKNKGRNIYYGIPFILGIIGIFWLLSGNRQKRRLLTIISLLFFMTGLAIVVYLNQTPGEPRERDYTFLVSYLAFALWIAAGFLAAVNLFFWVTKFLHGKWNRLIVICLGIIFQTPAVLMAISNFDDHDRRNRFEPSFYASSLLDFELPAIIFSHGDNSTFPLWYASEVLEMGPQHTPVDITYLSLPSYVVNLTRQSEKNIKINATPGEILYGKHLLSKIPHDSVSQPLHISDFFDKAYNTESSLLPSSKLYIPFNDSDSLLINLHSFSKGSSFLSFRHLMLLDILATQINDNNEKVLFFPSLIEHSFYAPLEPALKPALFGKIYAPNISDSIALVIMKESVARELSKLDNLKINPHYSDQIIRDRSVRYRGELIIAAQELLNHGDTVIPFKITEYINRYYPYSDLLPGTFTISDSTFYEGKEYIRLLNDLYEATGRESFKSAAITTDSIMLERKKEWLEYYKNLTPAQRSTLSNRSKRLIVN